MMTDMEQAPFDRREKLTAAWLLAAGFLFRAAYAWLAADVPPWNDMAAYDKARLQLLQGYYAVNDFPPLAPLFFAAVSALFGEGYRQLYVAQAAVSSATCLLLGLMARSLFGRTAGLAALAASCFYVDMVWFCGVLMGETVGIFIFSLSAYLLVSRRRPAWAGVVLGLACLTKGVYLISLPAFLAWLYFNTDGKKAALTAALRFTALVFLVISPWTVRNYAVQGRFVLITPNEGASLLMGHNPYATGGADFEWAATEYGSFYTDPSLSMVEMADIAREKALTFIRENPGREAQLVFLKLSKYWSLRTHFDMNNGPYPLKGPLYFLGMLSHALLFPAMLLGAFLFWRDPRARLPALVILVNTFIFITIYFASGRMRFQLVPFMVILAAGGFSLLPALAAALKGPDAAAWRRKLAWPAGLTLLLYANFLLQAAQKYADIARRF